MKGAEPKFTKAPGGSDISGAAIAADISRYIGRIRYVSGGAPASGGTDCSGLVNLALGRDFKLTLPGGIKNFTGSWHGPPSSMYLTWRGARTVGSPQAGDLVIWPGLGALGHIGIAMSSTEMVSALNPSMGVARTPIRSTHGGIPVYRRVVGAGASNPGGPVAALTSAPAAGCLGMVAITVLLLVSALAGVLAGPGWLAATGALGLCVRTAAASRQRWRRDEREAIGWQDWRRQEARAAAGVGMGGPGCCRGGGVPGAPQEH